MISSSGLLGMTCLDPYKILDIVPVDMLSKVILLALAVEKFRCSSFLVLQYSNSLYNPLF